MKKVIIIGASTGIGRALALEMSKKGYPIAIASRKSEELKAIASQCSNPVIYKQMDLLKVEESVSTFAEMIEELGGMDIVVLNSGIGAIYPSWQEEMKIIDVNVKGFVALANNSMVFFRKQGYGHLVGISSIASLVSSRKAAAYSASKAFISSYMSGLRKLSRKKNLKITVTDVKPGFILTPMTEKNRGMFWVASAERGAVQIRKAIERKADVVYVTRRWRLVAWLLKLAPERWIDIM